MLQRLKPWGRTIHLDAGALLQGLKLRQQQCWILPGCDDWALTQPPSWKKLKGLLMFHSINSYLKTQTDIDHMFIMYIYICVCVCDAENLKLPICSWEKPQQHDPKIKRSLKMCDCAYLYRLGGLPQPENLCHRRVHWGVHHPSSKINAQCIYIYTFHLKSHPIKQPSLIHQCNVLSPLMNHQLSSTIINYYQLQIFGSYSCWVFHICFKVFLTSMDPI